jgi:hypothetical protein
MDRMALNTVGDARPTPVATNKLFFREIITDSGMFLVRKAHPTNLNLGP